VVHRNGRLFENGNVIGHSTTHLEMGSRMVDRQPSTLNWTYVDYFQRPGRTSLFSNVVTFLVIVPPEVDVGCHNFSARDRDGCIFEE
jgi:hypothetical protein